MADQHPDDLTLADYVDGLLDELAARKVGRHVELCAPCAAAAERLGAVEVPAPAPVSTGPVVPAAVREAVAAGRTAAFQPGQLWRVAWQSRTALVAVTGPTTERRLPVVAAVAAAEADDGRGIDVPAAVDVLGFALRLHPATAADLPRFVFDILLAELGPLGTPDPPTPMHPLDPARQLDDALAEQLGWFADAAWLPETPSSSATVADVARRAGLRASQLADELGVDLPRAVQLLRDAAEPSERERDRLAELLGIPADTIGLEFSTLPDALVHAFDNPSLRPRLRARARRQNIDEPAAMRQVALAALRPAARRAGQPDAQLDWHQVIGDILAAEQP